MATQIIDGTLHLTKSEVKRRHGFTDAGIRDRLGRSDAYTVNPDRPWAPPMHMYAEPRVLDAVRVAVRQPVTRTAHVA
ncbi:hypothetical protein [Microbacterium laevaniformans]|uniref:hypothetical protein n=1 Tax=Microbacterium laevaniformans TaxID=36807 RepID=UPI003D955A5C